MHGGQRSELQALANFFKTRRVAVLGLERHQVVEHFFLSLGQGHQRDLAFQIGGAYAADHPWHQVRRKESERQAKVAAVVLRMRSEQIGCVEQLLAASWR